MQKSSGETYSVVEGPLVLGIIVNVDRDVAKRRDF